MVARGDWKKVDWRRHQRWVVVDGRPANLVDIGEGPPLVFVHGLGGAWQNWLENILEFARDHRVIAVDLPGFGASEMPREDISISVYGVWLDALLGELGLEAVTLVGNSMGGFISAEVAIKFPHRVERLVLVAAAGLTSEHLRRERLLPFLYAGEEIAQWMTARVVGRSHELVGRPRGRHALLWFVTPHAERWAPELVLEQTKGAGKPGFLPALDALTDYPIRDRIPEIRCPTLIVWGTEDRLVPLRDAHKFDKLIPDSRLVVYDDTGHVPMLEEPERFNRDLRAFLAEQPRDEDRRERLAERRGPRSAAR